MLRAYMTLEFDRPTGPNLFPSVGGFEVKLQNGQDIDFDFLTTYYNTDTHNPNIIHVECRHPDKDSFPDMADLERKLSQIQQLTECYIDYEGYEGTGVKPPHLCHIHSFVLESDNTQIDYPDTQFVHFQRLSKDHVQAILMSCCWQSLQMV